jgi:hypothetical protein
MPATYGQLDAADTKEFTAAADRWRSITAALDVDIDRYRSDVLDVVADGTWTGPAADAARTPVRDSMDRMVATRAYADGVAALLDASASGIGQAKDRLAEALGIAAAAGIPVDSDGRITPDLAFSSNLGDWSNPPVLAGMKAQNMIYQALHMADAVGAAIGPLIDNANKFTAPDEKWRGDATPDHQIALGREQILRGTLSSIAVDESPHRDTDEQPYGSMSPTVGDRAMNVTLNNAGEPYILATKGIHAAMLFSSWLANTGTSVPVEPEHVMNDVPKFKQAVLDSLTTEGDALIDTGWQNTNVIDDGTGLAQSEDWYYAMNDFRYRVVGRGYVSGGRQICDYSVGILKPYVFGDSGGLQRKPLHLPLGMTIDQHDLERQHLTGLARNMMVQGVTHFRTTYSTTSGTFDPDTTVTRSDPWPTV